MGTESPPSKFWTPSGSFLFAQASRSVSVSSAQHVMFASRIAVDAVLLYNHHPATTLIPLTPNGVEHGQSLSPPPCPTSPLEDGFRFSLKPLDQIFPYCPGRPQPSVPSAWTRPGASDSRHLLAVPCFILSMEDLPLRMASRLP